ncbi:polymorphic toxin type 15 domain-containing protein [Acidiphilium sp.]|uniref:polymorphic toxin type 15 domain-containing protein n=1 Tax=Acidiphilium sp. TaxID=527 RepID=UPI003CFEE520
MAAYVVAKLGIDATKKMLKHASNADEAGQSAPPTPLQSCPIPDNIGPDCFEPPDRSDPKKQAEFRRQLKAQQDGINKMSPKDVIDGIDKYATEGRGGYPGEAAMRKAFRVESWNNEFDRVLEETGDKALAKQQADEALRGTAALHNPDLVAGGGPKPTGIGGASENSSIGSQWAKKGPGSQLTRAQQLREEAEKAKAEGKQKMDVTLDECE